MSRNGVSKCNLRSKTLKNVFFFNGFIFTDTNGIVNIEVLEEKTVVDFFLNVTSVGGPFSVCLFYLLPSSSAHFIQHIFFSIPVLFERLDLWL